MSAPPFLPLDQSKADLVEVVESKEPWSEYKLADGSVVRVRQILVEVWRDRVQRDAEGNPVYHLNLAPIINLNHAPAAVNRSARRKAK